MKLMHGPHRLVVRTLRCGRDNPGSTPGVVIFSFGLILFMVNQITTNVGSGWFYIHLPPSLAHSLT
jgi:hypothetical protein